MGGRRVVVFSGAPRTRRRVQLMVPWGKTDGRLTAGDCLWVRGARGRGGAMVAQVRAMELREGQTRLWIGEGQPRIGALQHEVKGLNADVQ